MRKTVSGIGVERGGSPMNQALIRLEALIGLGSFIMIALLLLEEKARTMGVGSPAVLVRAAVLICVAIIATAGLYHLLRKSETFIDEHSLAQAQFLDSIDPKNVNVAILFSAALSLFLELAIIRWQASIFEFFAFYKNFSLLACFLGLGLGYALATRDRIPLVLVIPLLAWQFGFMTLVRFGPRTPFRAIPFREQLTMGLSETEFNANHRVIWPADGCIFTYSSGVHALRPTLRSRHGTSTEVVGVRI